MDRTVLLKLRKVFILLFLSLLLVLPAAAVDLPDLVVTDVTFSPANPSDGDHVIMTATVENQGTAATPLWTYLAVTFVVDSVTINYGGTFVPLDPGASTTISGELDVITDDPLVWMGTEGIHAIGAWVDDVDRIAESNEGNNWYYTNLTVSPAADPNQQSSARSAPQYNLRGATDLGDGDYQVLDQLCTFTPYLDINVYYGGRLNDVTYAYERGDTIEQSITYGASGFSVGRIYNPTGKIHVQAMKWNGEKNGSKPITITVTNEYNKVLYEYTSYGELLDVYLTLKGCTAEEFAQWIAANNPE